MLSKDTHKDDSYAQTEKHVTQQYDRTGQLVHIDNDRLVNLVLFDGVPPKVFRFLENFQLYFHLYYIINNNIYNLLFTD